MSSALADRPVSFAARTAAAGAALLAAAPRDGWTAPRRAALAALAARVDDTLPGRRDERWKYTPLTALADDPALPGDVARLRGSAGEAIAWLDLLPDGVELLRLDDLPAATVAAWLGRFATANGPAGARIGAYHDSLLGHGACLRIRAGCSAAAPLRVVLRGTAAAWQARTLLVVVESGARATLVEELAADNDAGVLTVDTRVVLEAGAALAHVRIAHGSAGARSVAMLGATLGADARYQLAFATTGTRLQRHDIAIDLDGDGCEAVVDGVFAGRDRDHLDHHLDLVHRARHTRSTTRVHGLADQQARGVCNGRIAILPGARATEARLNSRNLLLSARAHIDAKPELEIDHDDVRCAHGATVGSIDAAALFYLRSRGLDAAAARRLLLGGFVDQVCAAVAEPALAAELHARVLQHLDLQP